MSKINLHNYEAFLIDYLDGNLNETSIIELKAFVLANPQLEIDLNDLDLPSFANDDTKIDFKNELKRSEPFIEDEELINYLENNLPEAERKVFEANLLTNKELTIKLQAYKKAVLGSDQSVTLINKKELYKTEDELILNNAALSYAEDQLSVLDKVKFEKELKTNTVLQKEFASFQKTKLKADRTIVFENKEALKKEAVVIALFSFRNVASMAAAILLLIGLAFVFNYYNTKPAFAKTLAKVNFNKTFNNAKDQSVNKVGSSNNLNTVVLESTNLIAKKTNKEEGNKVNNNVKQIDLNEPKTNSVAAINEKNEVDPITNKDPENVKEAVANNKSMVDTSNADLANTNLNAPNYSKQNYLIAVEEVDDDEVPVTAPVKKSFWQRAVKVAKQVNKLGVKAIDGEESQGKNYALSFNSFSVEKR